ncbi:Bug family tripartite tricarboxylate transporter substrate binding protein [Ottowia thiooxydans]|uniref:Bug family tripartite tricarboxylate transporter substrate binding protein n=1 Tax=Ottowia thiooxydans TaxID=219182 RepID=UPI0004081B23|nr:tripartite tricarboxylate transporter substrate binding protein [Ottowia thiooxydans]
MSKTDVSTKSMHRRTVLGALGAGLAAHAMPVFSQADAWRPSKPIRLINGFAAGGSGDLVCRILAEGLRPILGQAVVVETRAGANGFIAAEAVARSVPDGLTIGFATMSMLAVAPQLPGMKIPFDPKTDLTPIGSVANIFSLLVSSNDAPFKTVPELIAHAKAHPGAISYASAGTGSIGHLAGELFRRQANIDIVHVPYKGGSQAMIDLQAGRVQMLLGNMSDYLGQVKAGQLRGIAFGGERASPQLAGLPLISRTLPDFNMSNWFSIVGPANMPQPITNALSSAIQKALADPGVIQRLSELGAEPLSSTQPQFVRLIEAERTRWGDVIRSANIRVE